MFANQQPVLASGEAIIVVTGVSGFVGSHVADQLLDAGYIVRGTTRDGLKNEWISQFFINKYGAGKFELVTIPRFDESGAFDTTLQGLRASGVIHVASDMTFCPDPHEVISPTVAGTLALLEAAAKLDSIRRFVLSSSCAAAASPEPGVSRVINQDTWNSAAIDQAWAPPPYDRSRGFSVYAASKAQSEKEAWQWYRKNKPHFILNTVIPAMNFGRSLVLEHQGHPSTSGLIAALFHNDTETVKTGAQYFCLSVEDNARLHIATLLHPGVSDERVFAYGQPYTWRGIQQLLKKLYPEKIFAPDMPDALPDGSQIVPAPRAMGLLQDIGRGGWTGLEEIVRLNTEDLAVS
ncbi:hypothetical protein V495_01194 [Pseudogymnoascus sp. VKM F-4514 (FW-929)]|nr:hypothetical protein V495_01194 [Pseudogymnoascus sp. VKM F-4514 (FW-929)]KFY64478.1 hypothetical protein V497_01689 [Pseudogymnoascus sp. VKM F-4516 (FW-969)]